MLANSIFMKIRLFLFVALVVGVSSCKLLNPSIMFKTPSDYQFDTPPDSISPQYRISPNDFVSFQLFANDGFKIIDMMSATGGQGGGNPQMMMMMQNGGGFRYLVNPDSTVKLPILGLVNIAGMTLREAEAFLQKEYATFYNDPYVILNVSNRRVLVFSGTDGLGTVVPLQNENMSLIEVLAMAGGITQTGKAYKIKVVRGLREGNEPKVFEVDLSTIEGLKDADMVMQANDLVYVEPRLNLASDALREITPIVSLITSTLLLISLFNNN